MRTTVIAALACTALVACTSSYVEKPMTNQGETMHFKNLDRSEDLKLTRDELPTDHELFLAFDAHDLNDDGAISEHEFGEYLEDLPD